MITVVEPHVLEIALVGGTRLTENVTIPSVLRVLEREETLPKGFGLFRVLTAKDGDKRVTWDSRSFEQITEAKSMFDDLVSKGQVPYKVGLNGKATSEVMTEFDPHAEEIIFLPVPMLTGG
jgi:hypothetical protein